MTNCLSGEPSKCTLLSRILKQFPPPIDELKQLLELECCDVNKHNLHGHTPIILSVVSGEACHAIALINSGAIVDNNTVFSAQELCPHKNKIIDILRSAAARQSAIKTLAEIIQTETTVHLNSPVD